MALITLGANSGKGKVLQVSDIVSINTEQTLATETYTDLTSAR